MQEEGLLSFDEESRTVSLSWALYRLSRKICQKFSLAAVVDLTLNDLSSATGGTGLFAAFDVRTNSVSFVSCVESSLALRYVPNLDVPNPIYFGASGLAVLANLRQPDQDLVLSRLPVDLRPESARLRGELSRISEQGFAVTRGERTPGAVGVFSPVYKADNQVCGSVGISLPEYVFDETDSALVASAVMKAATAVTDAFTVDSANATTRSAPSGQPDGAARRAVDSVGGRSSAS
jgi:DNA-binding IclR family transcriptional regulator